MQNISPAQDERNRRSYSFDTKLTFVAYIVNRDQPLRVELDAYSERQARFLLKKRYGFHIRISDIHVKN
jgi:hypothetical protein